MPDQTTEQVNFNRNPTGKGGFQDHPELINAGGRPKNQESFTYWINFFKNLTVEDFKNWQKEIPDNKRTVAANLAYARVVSALSSLKDFREIADRTEGRPTQQIRNSGSLNFDIKKVEEVIDNILNEPYDKHEPNYSQDLIA